MSIDNTDIKELIEIDNTIKTIEFEDNKPIPDGTSLTIIGRQEPDLIDILYKFQNNKTEFKISALPVLYGKVIIPIHLSFCLFQEIDCLFVNKLIEKLREIGILIWSDDLYLSLGCNIKSERKKGIVNSDFFLIFISSKSKHLINLSNEEIALAFSICSSTNMRKCRMIPVLIDNCELPDFLSDYHPLKIDEPNWFIKLGLMLEPNSIKYLKDELL